MKKLAVLALLVCALPIGAQTKDPPAAPAVLFPVNPTPPPVAPTPGAPTRLSPEQLFVFRSDKKCIVLVSPQGFVKVSSDPGPLRIRAKFTDGDGSYQSKTYSEKYVYTVEGLQVGAAELLIVPDGASDADVIRKPFEIVSGLGPPAPGPDPPAPTDPFAQSLRAAFVADPDRDKAASASFLAGVYRAIAGKINDPAFTTFASIMGKIKASIDEPVFGLPAGALPATRKAIGAELNKTLPTTSPNTPLDQPTRNLIAAQFLRVADALKGLK